MFCPENKDKYCAGNPTIKSRILAIEDWLIIYNAVVRLQPSDIKSSLTIDHHDFIRSAASAAIEKVAKED